MTDGPRTQVPQRSLAEIAPLAASQSIRRLDFAATYGEMPAHELEAVCQLAAAIQPATIFEIGTFLGGTTVHLAANTAGRLFTLDLGPQDAALRPLMAGFDPVSDVLPDEPGQRFVHTPYAVRITQLLGDSQTFDIAPYAGKMDFVLVDAGHRYEQVVRDSQTALAMRSARGMVVWHDYAAYEPGVVRALNELASDLPLVQVDGTSLVVYLNPAGT